MSEARAAIACRSKEELGISGAEIARYLGVSTSSINRTLVVLHIYFGAFVTSCMVVKSTESHPLNMAIILCYTTSPYR